MNAYLYPSAHFRASDVTTVTLDGAVYEVCIDVVESQSGGTLPEVYAMKMGGKWHSSEALAADFVLQLNAQLRAELLRDAIESMEPLEAA